MTLDSEIVQKEVKDIILQDKKRPKVTQIRKIF